MSPVELINVQQFGWKNDLVILFITEYGHDEGEIKDSDNEETNDDQDNSTSDLEDSNKEHKGWLISYCSVVDILLCNHLHYLLCSN